jgi:hypothetical protein
VTPYTGDVETSPGLQVPHYSTYQDRFANISMHLSFGNRKNIWIFCFNTDSFFGPHARSITQLFPGVMYSEVLLVNTPHASCTTQSKKPVFSHFSALVISQFVPVLDIHSLYCSRNFINCDCILKEANLA